VSCKSDLAIVRYKGIMPLKSISSQK